jgi:hypothetical protein
MVHEPPSPQWRQDQVTIEAMRGSIRHLEYEVAQAERRKQRALDFVWRETVKLLEDPEITRKRLRQSLWVIILKARAGHASNYNG